MSGCVGAACVNRHREGPRVCARRDVAIQTRASVLHLPDRFAIGRSEERPSLDGAIGRSEERPSLDSQWLAMTTVWGGARFREAVASRPEMAPQSIGKIDSAPRNGMAAEASNPRPGARARRTRPADASAEAHDRTTRRMTLAPQPLEIAQNALGNGAPSLRPPAGEGGAKRRMRAFSLSPPLKSGPQMAPQAFEKPRFAPGNGARLVAPAGDEPAPQHQAFAFAARLARRLEMAPQAIENAQNALGSSGPRGGVVRPLRPAAP